VNGCYYLGDRLNASGGCESAVTAKARHEWMKYSCGKKISLKMKTGVHQTCVRSATPYSSDTWCLIENHERYGESNVWCETE